MHDSSMVVVRQSSQHAARANAQLNNRHAARTCMACVPKRMASERPWASGEPPPQGSVSRRRRAMAMDLEGGSSTSA